MFLYSGAIPNIIQDKFADKFRLELYSTESRIIFADGTLGSGVGSISGILLSFESELIRHYFLVIASVAYDLIIGAPTLVEMRDCIDISHQTLTIRNNSKTEALNLVYEPET